MKKLFFILSFTLISNHLFSKPLFKEGFYELIISNIVKDIFKKNPELGTITNIDFLKYVAEQYLEIFENQEINAQNIHDYFPSNTGEAFGLNDEQAMCMIKAFIDILEEWQHIFKQLLRRIFVECTASDELKELAGPLNDVDVKKLIEVSSFENVALLLIQEEGKAFAETLIQLCKKELENKPKEVETKDLYGNTIDFGKNLLKNTAHFAGGAAIGAIGLGTLGIVLNTICIATGAAPENFGFKEVIETSREASIGGISGGIMAVGYIKARPMLKQWIKNFGESL